MSSIKDSVVGEMVRDREEMVFDVETLLPESDPVPMHAGEMLSRDAELRRDRRELLAGAKEILARAGEVLAKRKGMPDESTEIRRDAEAMPSIRGAEVRERGETRRDG